MYLERIKPFITAPVVKVITGMRRVGKSVFLRQIAELVQSENRSAHTIFINMELLENRKYRNPLILHDLVTGRKGDVILLIDEVQEIESWETMVASLLARGGIDIYLTGSNAGIFTTEIATKISGRYIEFHLHPLGLSEFIEFRADDAGSLEDEFGSYLRFGGMPALHSMELNTEIAYQYLSSVFDTVMLNDVVARNNVRNIPLLESLFAFIADNIGSLYSAKKIADYLSSLGRSSSVNTVVDYLYYLREAYAIHHVSRYDIKGKRKLEYTGKAFLTDLAFRHAMYGFRDGDIAGFLENIVFMELLRRGYSVHVGCIGTKEVDFIATRNDEIIYIQVTYLLASRTTVEREFSVLDSVKDNYPKYVLSMDQDFPSRNGIKQMYIPRFLIGRGHP